MIEYKEATLYYLSREEILNIFKTTNDEIYSILREINENDKIGEASKNKIFNICYKIDYYYRTCYQKDKAILIFLSLIKHLNYKALMYKENAFIMFSLFFANTKMNATKKLKLANFFLDKRRVSFFNFNLKAEEDEKMKENLSEDDYDRYLENSEALKSVRNTQIVSYLEDINILDDDEITDDVLTSYFKYLKESRFVLEYAYETYYTNVINFDYLYDYYLVRANMLNILKKGTVSKIQIANLEILKNYERLDMESKRIIFDEFKLIESRSGDAITKMNDILEAIKYFNIDYFNASILNMTEERTHFAERRNKIAKV